MQRRLLISTLAVAVVAVLLLGIPLGYLVTRERASSAVQELRHDATTVATGLQDRVDAGLPPDAAEMGRSLSDRYVIISQRGGGRTMVGSKPPAARHGHRDQLDQGLQGHRRGRRFARSPSR